MVLIGSFDEAFLAIPPEVILTTIRANQKCFVLRDPKRGKLANRFVLVANIEAPDGGKAIVAGNERVIRARLSDARFFYDTDLTTAARGHGMPKLDERSSSTRSSARRASASSASRGWRRRSRRWCGADVEKAKRAAVLAKADLTHRHGRRVPRSCRA